MTLLRHHGYHVTEAADGSQGLAALRAERPDLVIADVLMPIMDGYEFVRRLRLDSTTRGIPVVFYTAHYGELEARALARAGGVSDVLTKPAEAARVLSVVARVLAGELGAEPPEDVMPPRSEFERGQIRLLTAKLWEKAGDVRRANARLRALINIGLDFASERDSERRLQRACASVRDLFGATYVTLGIVDAGDPMARVVVTCGVGPGEWIKTGDAMSAFLATVVAERRTLRGENPGGDPARMGLPVPHQDAQAFLAVPIASVDHAYGWMCLVGNEGRTFSEDDEHMVTALAVQIGRIFELEHEIQTRKHVESALREERNRAQRYLDTADVVLLSLDLEGRITLINRKGCDVLGWSASELTGRDWINTCVPLRSRNAGRLLFHCSSTDDRPAIPVGEGLVVTRSGEERLIEWRNTVQRDERGHVVGTFSSGADITERRALEERDRHMQKMETVGQLAGGMAHDFNNLLTVILGSCALLLADLRPDDPRWGDIAEIQKAGERAEGLTRQLLAFSRKQIIEPTLFDLNLLLSEMQSMLTRLIAADVRIVLRLGAEPSPLTADRGQVEQVVMNLAVNAQDAMPHGGTLTIETANVEFDERDAAAGFAVAPGPYVRLTITDTGTGMTPEVQARLFEPYFTTKEPGKGTGLGLATVDGIATRCGGGVRVRSEVGKGTSLDVYFPRATATGPMAVARVPVAGPVPGPLADPETVLVVEDEDALRELTRRLLQRQGYAVVVAANAEEAVQRFTENPAIDILVTDVVMPGASGPELTKQLLALRPGLKVIYVSGYTEDAIVQHGVITPGIAFLSKPFTADTLGRKVREVLAR